MEKSLNFIAKFLYKPCCLIAFFSVMAAGLLDSTGHFLESGLDQCCSDLHSEAEHGEDQR